MNHYESIISKVKEKNLPFIFYAAGAECVKYLAAFSAQNLRPFAICDSDPQKIGTPYEGYVVQSLESVQASCPNFVAVISANTSTIVQPITDHLSTHGIPENRIVRLELRNPEEIRAYCAYFHEDSMDDYFDKAQSEASLNIFWGEKSPFLKLFQKLDLTNVVELACGRGRHVPKYIADAKKVTLVDVLEKNIEMCRTQFSDFDNISYYVNDGNSFSELPNDSYSALFTYDAMVHFESIDVYAYLKDTFRILQEGGRALFHHSNNTYDYKQSFTNSFQGTGRSYMSAQLFAHFAYRAGLTILEQKVIDWGAKDIDCITLVEKPKKN